MAGIYVHIPYCKNACHYCNFHFSTSLKTKNDFLQALLREIDLKQNYLQGQPVETIYFGGGTPSLLTAKELSNILQHLAKRFGVLPTVEVTLEANPDDVNTDIIHQWGHLGINRLSVGVQSFYDEHLLWMRRVHTGREALQAIEAIRQAGMNLTVDLIYGYGLLTDDQWRQNLLQAIELGIPHISCYALTVEPKTLLHHLITKNLETPISIDDQARQFEITMDVLGAHDYEHYEISNFARPGFRSRHNSSYWEGKKYLGLGPSAHSYNGSERSWNVSSNELYIRSVASGNILQETEVLTTEQVFNEWIMTSLRRSEGIDFNVATKRFSSEKVSWLLQRSQKFIDRRLVVADEGSLRLTREGKMFADGIAADLFF